MTMNCSHQRASKAETPMTSLNTVVRLVLLEESRLISEDDVSRAASFAKNRGVMSRFFSGSDILGDVVKLRSKTLGSFQWVVSGVSPDGELFLLTSRDGSVPKADAAVVSSAAMVPSTYNATPQSVAQIVRQKFPVESSDFDWGSLSGGKAVEKRQWDAELVAIQRAPHLAYIISNRFGIESSYTDSTGAETTAIGKVLTSEPIDTLLDMSALAADIMGLEFIGAAIGSGQVTTKIAKGDWLGLLMDIIGLVPAVGEAAQSAGKTMVSYVKAAPRAIPTAAVEAFKAALEKVASFIAQKMGQKTVEAVVTESLKGVSATLSLARAAAIGNTNGGVPGAIIAMLFVLMGRANLVKAFNGITAAVSTMIAKLKKILASRQSPQTQSSSQQQRQMPTAQFARGQKA